MEIVYPRAKLAFIVSVTILLTFHLCFWKQANLYKNLVQNREILRHILEVTDTIVEKIDNKHDNVTRIAILVPTTTRRMRKIQLENLSLVKICLSSLLRTMEKEYDYRIYIGVEKEDPLVHFKDNVSSISDSIRFTTLKKGGTFTKVVNELATIAYSENVTYFVRVNDDTFFATDKWTSNGISALRNLTPSNIGVVGPTCSQGNTRILTHDMVHRHHLDMFGFYYPPEFENWWSDDWITKVYLPDRSKKLRNWIVHHKMIHGTRYKVRAQTSNRLKNLTLDKVVLQNYLSKLSTNLSKPLV